MSTADSSTQSFWHQLPRPFLVLAPMDDVTDVVFRELVAEEGRPDVFVTEFTNCDALFSAGRDAHIHRLKFTENQRPIVAQIWGANPETHVKTAQLAAEMGFDGIDINMGCPDRTIRKSGACSALIDNPSLASEVIAATKEGAGDLPVSVKTRLGTRSVEIEKWLGFLLQQDITVLTIHMRTVSDMSQVPARWELMPEVVALRDEIAPQTLLIGNGDVQSRREAVQKAAQKNIEGVMIGRGIFANPWVFTCDGGEDKKVGDRLEMLSRHVEEFIKTWGEEKNPALMKKFTKMYVSGFRGAASLRAELMEAETLDVVQSLVKKELRLRQD